MTVRKLYRALALMTSLAFSPGCGDAYAAGFPDFGSVINLTGTGILASSGAYTAGDTFYPGGATRLSMWATVVFAAGSNLTSVSVQLTCGYNAASDIILPTTWANQNAPTLAQTQALTGTVATTTYQLLQSGAITGAKAGCALNSRSGTASAGIAGDQIRIFAYGY